MINKFTLWLAIKCWFASPKERPIFIMSLFGVIGITIGVAALVIVMSVMNGFRVELESNIRGVASDVNILPANNQYIKEHNAIKNILKANKNIVNINNIIVGQGLLTSEHNSSAVIFRGMNLQALIQKKQIIHNLVAGSLKEFTNQESILIGIELAQKLGVRIGDRVRLMLPSVNISLIGMIPRVKEFEVIAIYHSKLYEYDLGTIIMQYDIASKLLSTQNNPNSIEVDLLPQSDVNQYTEIISQELLKYPVNITNW